MVGVDIVIKIYIISLVVFKLYLSEPSVVAMLFLYLPGQ